ncbi:MAG TPA: carboxypeptidase-like regulatory domain-containing protein [Chitinophagaceae bacterium]|nr:carboxypeptidase-like regulatory domain-containing protein [Chitinophagaceae bacterium]
MSRIYSLLLVTIFFAVTIPALGQVRVSGKVMDSDTRLPLSLASVTDRQEGTGTLTGPNGNFSIQVRLGDWLVFSFLGYGPDSSRVTYAVRDSAILIVYLRKSPFALSGVNVTTRSLDYQRDSMERRYLFGSTLDQQKTRGFAAVAHPLSGLYDLLSKKQRRVWKFQKMYRAYENEQYILSRIRLSVLQNLTGLQGGDLTRFLGWYKPDYNYVRNATDYELYEDIKAAAIQFRMMMQHDTLYEPPGVPDQDN